MRSKCASWSTTSRCAFWPIAIANLHFALLTDLPDSVSNPHEKDSHPLVDLASRLIIGVKRKVSIAR